MKEIWTISRSTRRDKKYMVTNSRITVHFGAVGYSDYTLHKDISRRDAYDARHFRRENWNDPTTAGFWAKWILWNKTSLRLSIAATQKKFRMTIKYNSRS